jgi:hypothetical protein
MVTPAKRIQRQGPERTALAMAAGRIVLVLFLTVGAGAALLAGYTWLTLYWSYADGERAGYVQKFSKKGWLCKTWEGELVLVTMPGAIPEKFEFSVRNEAVARQILDNTGKRVVLVYAQHKGVPSSCFGETEYFIEKVQGTP